MENPRRRYVIIGSGVAGIAAAQAIREKDTSGEIHLISDDPAGYYSRPGLAYFLTGELVESQLFPFKKKDFQALNLSWYQAKIAKVSPVGHRVVFENGAALSYDRLLIATGAQAAPLNVPGANLQGVYKLDNLADARMLLKHNRRASAAVVVGGGITALELVEGLRAHRTEVHYFLRGTRYWNNVLDATESSMIESRLQHEGVQIHYQAELAEILGRNNQVVGVRTKDGQEMRCQVLAYAIGVQPRMALAQAAGLRVERGILVNEQLQTSEPDIFAAGDVAQVYDPFSGQTVLDTLWNSARDEGACAGRNMADHTTIFQKNAPLNITRLAGITTTIIGTVGKGSDPSLPGIARGDSETWRQLPIHTVAETHSDADRLRLLVSEHHLLGAVVMGDQSISIPVQHMVAQKADITPIRQEILTGGDLSSILRNYWTQRRISNASEKS